MSFLRRHAQAGIQWGLCCALHPRRQQAQSRMLKFEMAAIGVYTISGFLTDAECRDQVAHAEKSGFEGALISRAGTARRIVRSCAG
jgi:hypothetical protein